MWDINFSGVPNRTVIDLCEKHKSVRIFTYLIGKEVEDVKNLKDLTCSNLGNYVHLTTLAEVREQVLNYVPVMARPLVLGGDDHPIVWSQTYADVIVSILMSRSSLICLSVRSFDTYIANQIIIWWLRSCWVYIFPKEIQT